MTRALKIVVEPRVATSANWNDVVNFAALDRGAEHRDAELGNFAERVARQNSRASSEAPLASAIDRAQRVVAPGLIVKASRRMLFAIELSATTRYWWSERHLSQQHSNGRAEALLQSAVVAPEAERMDVGADIFPSRFYRLDVRREFWSRIGEFERSLAMIHAEIIADTFSAFKFVA